MAERQFLNDRPGAIVLLRNLSQKMFIAKNSIDISDIARSFDTIKYIISEISQKLQLKEDLMINITLEDVEAATDKQKSISNNFKKVELMINAIIHSVEVGEIGDIKDMNTQGIEFSVLGKPVTVKKSFDAVNMYHDDFDVHISDAGCDVVYKADAPIHVGRT